MVGTKCWSCKADAGRCANRRRGRKVLFNKCLGRRDDCLLAAIAETAGVRTVWEPRLGATMAGGRIRFGLPLSSWGTFSTCPSWGTHKLHHPHCRSRSENRNPNRTYRPRPEPRGFDRSCGFGLADQRTVRSAIRRVPVTSTLVVRATTAGPQRSSSGPKGHSFPQPRPAA